MKRLNPSEYNDLHAQQKGTCAICHKQETRTKKGKVVALAVDHCHITGKIRGLLCGECNTGLGKFKDNPFLLKAALKYLEVNSAN